MILPTFSRHRVSRLLGAGVVMLSAASLVAQAADETDEIVPLDALVISATRTPQETSALSASVSALDLTRLQEAQVSDLHAALDRVPGVSVAATGAAGGPVSVFMRGASSHQVLFFVDGVRMNDRSTAYFNFLGGADLGGLERLEVLRGPQSTLYGSSAMGGVILLETRRARGETAGEVSASAGSFGTFGGSASLHGSRGALSFGGSLSHRQTDNDRPQNHFEQWSGSARLEAQATDAVRVGATLRVQRGEAEEPGSRFFAFPGSVEADNTLATAFAEWKTRDDVVISRVTYGRHERDYAFVDADPTNTFGDSDSHNRRDILDWQTAWKTAPGIELVGGANAEWSRYTISGWRTTDRVLASYASATVRIAEQLTLNAGVRHDDFHSVGAATTGRAGAAWMLNDNRTKLRASIGTGFTAPGSDDVMGVPQWGQIGNPDLQPEKSTGWDAGIDHAFAADRVTASATYFQNRFRNLFDYDFNPTTFEGQVINRLRAATRGVELSLEARPHALVTLAGNYTYLEAFDRDTHARLIRRPRHTADFDTRVQVASRLLVGGGVHLVGNRLDNTPAGTTRIGDYTTVRLYASWSVRDDLTVRARIENALDEQYDEIAGYAALPRAVYGSVDWRF